MFVHPLPENATAWDALTNSSSVFPSPFGTSSDANLDLGVCADITLKLQLGLAGMDGIGSPTGSIGTGSAGFMFAKASVNSSIA